MMIGKHSPPSQCELEMSSWLIMSQDSLFSNETSQDDRVSRTFSTFNIFLPETVGIFRKSQIPNSFSCCFPLVFSPNSRTLNYYFSKFLTTVGVFLCLLLIEFQCKTTSESMKLSDDTGSDVPVATATSRKKIWCDVPVTKYSTSDASNVQFVSGYWTLETR